MSIQSSREVFRTILWVKEVKQLTPHYIRVTLTGDTEDINKFSNTTVGANNKLFIAPNGIEEIHFPIFDYEKHAWIHPEEHLQPHVRTYTHRGISLEKNEIYIEFVAHGDNGPASAWASKAKPGDKIGVAMKNGKVDLYPPADWYLLAGDATAIPVLGAILETLPASAQATVIIEVMSSEDEQKLHSNANVIIKWLHNPHPEQGSVLSEEVRKVVIPEVNSKFGYVAAEFTTVKAIRSYLRQELNWSVGELYALSYWKAGVSEDRSAKERKTEKQDGSKI